MPNTRAERNRDAGAVIIPSVPADPRGSLPALPEDVSHDESKLTSVSGRHLDPSRCPA